MEKRQNRSDVEDQFSPVNWGYVLANARKAYISYSPTLARYDQLYGDGSAQNWVNQQVTAIYGTSSNHDMTITQTINIFAGCLAYEASLYKMSEMMLFFARYNSGKYSKSYSTFDVHQIGNAFFNCFLTERSLEITSYERQQEKLKREQERIKWKRTAITREEWEEIKMITAIQNEYCFIHNDADKPPYHKLR